MIEQWETHSPMRQSFYRMNGITHAEIWDTENGYVVALCSAPNVGFPESRECGTPGACIQWARKYCPELDLIG